MNEALIVFLVPAMSESQALARSKVTRSRVVSEVVRPVESFTAIHLFENRMRSALTERWGELPAAISAESEVGSRLIEDALSATEREFRENFQQLTTSIDEYSEDEFLNNENMVRDLFLALGAFVGPSVRVYSQQGYPLRSRAELAEYRRDHDSLWVVPAEARY